MDALPAARPEEVGLCPARLDHIGQVLRDSVARGHLPGAVALVARHGRIAWCEAFGRRDPEAPDPMRTDTVFRIYSMTKPLVSVAVMMLLEEGRLLLGDPVGKYLPDLAAPKLLSGEAAAGPIAVQDLLRHTSGLTYEFRGNGPVHKAYMDAKIFRRGQTSADQVAMLGRLPLLHQPGTRWEYGRSTDVLGRLVEVLSGESLGAFLARRILRPLGMADSGFHVPAAEHGRLAEAFAKDPEGGAPVQLLEVKEKPSFESGGGGMVSTAGDYLRFCQMLLEGGRLGGTRLLSRKSVELMTADHLGPITGSPDLLPPGHGFGLGFAVRTGAGIASTPGSPGLYYWSGMAGTSFWVDPAERLIAVLMTQAPMQREYYRALFRNLVYAAIAD
jgi:CubicO group peptidase (beta-lactamase class C family)